MGIGFILFTSSAKTVIEGLSYKSSNEAIIQLDEDSTMLRTSNDRSIVCCDNYSYAPNVKCVKQLDQNTCKLPNSDGTCSGDKDAGLQRLFPEKPQPAPDLMPWL